MIRVEPTSRPWTAWWHIDDLTIPVGDLLGEALDDLPRVLAEWEFIETPDPVRTWEITTARAAGRGDDDRLVLILHTHVLPTPARAASVALIGEFLRTRNLIDTREDVPA